MAPPSAAMAQLGACQGPWASQSCELSRPGEGSWALACIDRLSSTLWPTFVSIGGEVRERSAKTRGVSLAASTQEPPAAASDVALLERAADAAKRLRVAIAEAVVGQ